MTETILQKGFIAALVSGICMMPLAASEGKTASAEADTFTCATPPAKLVRKEKKKKAEKRNDKQDKKQKKDKEQ